jgi:hypothetical protein
VQVLGAVDAGADLHAVVEQVGELLLVHEGEVGHQGELQFLAELLRAPPRVAADVLHHREVDQRLAALELDGDEGAGAAQRELDGLLGHFGAHVRLDLIHVGARGVAVHAGLVAAQRDHEDVQVRPGVQEAPPHLHGLHRAAHVVLGAQEIAGDQTRVQLAARHDRAGGEAPELLAAQQRPRALEAGDQHLVADRTVAKKRLRTRLRAQGDEVQRTRGERAHVAPPRCTVTPST